MADVIKKFDEFIPGMHTHFFRAFAESDFNVFSELSGDLNPLHHDVSYASNSEFKKPIVPLHLTALPLSRIAGMLMPGMPSLYLAHELRAIKPVFYGDNLCYSARITNISRPDRILNISVIVFRKTEVVLTADMTVRSRLDEWRDIGEFPLCSPHEKKWALITGAGGEIGSSIAMAFAKCGLNLFLHFHNENEKAHHVIETCKKYEADVSSIFGSLDDTNFIYKICNAIESDERISILVHTASPRIDASLQNLVAVNYSALENIVNAIIPNCLKRQDGLLVSVGSSALIYRRHGWENYVAAKAMAANFMAGISNEYQPYGIKAFTFSPGFAKTEFSKPYRDLEKRALLPEEIADMLSGYLSRDIYGKNFILYEPGILREGNFGFQEVSYAQRHKTAAVIESVNAPEIARETGGVAKEKPTDQGLAEFVRNFLKLPDNFDLTDAELGVTPGWDSLRHLEMLVNLEKHFNVFFTSEEIDKTIRFSTLCRLLQEKTGKQSIVIL